MPKYETILPNHVFKILILQYTFPVQLIFEHTCIQNYRPGCAVAPGVGVPHSGELARRERNATCTALLYAGIQWRKP